MILSDEVLDLLEHPERRAVQLRNADICPVISRYYDAERGPNGPWKITFNVCDYTQRHYNLGSFHFDNAAAAAAFLARFEFSPDAKEAANG